MQWHSQKWGAELWSVDQRCKQVIFCKSKSSPKSLIASPKSMLGVASQVTTYSRVRSQPSASHVKSLVFGFKSSQVTHVYCMSCTYTSMYSFIVYSLWLNIFCTWISLGNFILLGLNVFFKGLNWFYYILSKASDLRCQQVIFSKSQVMDSKSKSSPKSMREVASQVTSHKNGDSSRTRVQVTWLESTSLVSTSQRRLKSSQTLVSEDWGFTSIHLQDA